MDDYDMEDLVDDYFTEKSVGGSEHLDRLSELPESLIEHVLSFLPMRDVVSTTLLSKRWENLWMTLPCLNFSNLESGYELDSPRLKNFVNRALMFWRGTKILKFIINIEQFFDKSLIDDMNLWVQYAVKCKVEELNISLKYDIFMPMDLVQDVYMVPQCLNLCSSIRKLSLVGCHLRMHGSPAWSQLRSLRIDTFSSSEDLINQILLGSPQLEEFELRFREKNENLNIWSTSLRKLKITKVVSKVEPQLDTALRINCPILETLEISGVFYGKCSFTNVSSLTDATLVSQGSQNYNFREFKLLGETMGRIFSTFQHVERVTLSHCCFKVLQASMKENLFSPLPNVVFLKLEAFSSQLAEMVHVLEIFPNLKMLALTGPTFSPKYLKFEPGLSKSVLLQLKIVEISLDFNDSSSFRSKLFWLIGFFLKHCTMLEKMVIRANRYASRARLLKITERVLSMPRSSPTAKVIFYKGMILFLES